MAHSQARNPTKNDEKRQRKKKLISDVRQQLEFYFSSANLQKDMFMKELLAENPYIKLKIFDKFNKIKNLTTDPNILIKAVETSQVLELSDDKLGVKTKVPVQIKENELDCTIYVEDIPATADHDWVRNLFSHYGNIDYVSIPRYKETGNVKGFAFVEFQTEGQARKAIAAFGGETSFGEDLKSEDLLSVQTFYNTDVESNKRPLSDEGSIEPDQSKRVKQESDTGKKKKKRRRKTKEKEDNSLFLKVMSKRQWKGLRNRYLTEMRLNKKMAQSYFGSYGESSSGQRFRVKNMLKKEALDLSEVAKMPVFVPNVIVKIDVLKAPSDKKAFKQTISEQYSGVAYVDIDHLFNVIHIRFNTAEDASKFVQTSKLENKSLLQDHAESSYWENTYASWMQSRNKSKKKLNSGKSEANANVSCN